MSETRHDGQLAEEAERWRGPNRSVLIMRRPIPDIVVVDWEKRTIHAVETTRIPRVAIVKYKSRKYLKENPFNGVTWVYLDGTVRSIINISAGGYANVEPHPCGCGCGELTRAPRFLKGHHFRLKPYIDARAPSLRGRKFTQEGRKKLSEAQRRAWARGSYTHREPR